jgi:hypothetical protein
MRNGAAKRETGGMLRQRRQLPKNYDGGRNQRVGELDISWREAVYMQ